MEKAETDETVIVSNYFVNLIHPVVLVNVEMDTLKRNCSFKMIYRYIFILNQ